MNILTVCDEGNNRSVQFAHLLKYWNNDVLACGLRTNHHDTLWMLFEWANKIILTAKDQTVPPPFRDKVLLLDVGADVYPRPFNKELLAKAKSLLEKHKGELKQ